jgi:hypothetical protein
VLREIPGAFFFFLLRLVLTRLCVRSPVLNKTMSMEAIAALRGNEIDTVRDLLQRNKLRPNTPLVDGLPPLAFALSPGQVDLAELLLDAGADVETRVGGMTALGCAVKNRDLALAKLLLARGADGEGVVHDEGYTGLGLAVSLDNPSEEMLRLLMRYRCSPDHIFTLGSVAYSPRSLAFAKKKQVAIAVFAEMDAAAAVAASAAKAAASAATAATATSTTTAAAAVAAPVFPTIALPPMPTKLGKKGKNKGGIERRRPGSHWNSDDFTELAELLVRFADGAKFTFNLLYELLPQHGKVTIQKHLVNAVGGDKTVAFERLTPMQWRHVVARLHETAKEKALKAAAPPAPKRVRVAGEEKPPKPPRVALPPAMAAVGVGGAIGAAAMSNANREALPELSFRPLEGYVWFPGIEVLLAPPQPVVMPDGLVAMEAARAAAAAAAVPPPPPQPVAPPVFVNDVARMQRVVQEILIKRKT